MNVFWKRMGFLGLAVTALLASLSMQLIMGVIAMLPAAFMAGIEAGMSGITDVSGIEELVMEKAMGSAIWGVLCYHVISLPVFGLWYYYGCGRHKPVSPIKIFRGKSFAGTCILGFGLCVVANGIAMILQYLTPALFEEYLQLVENAGLGVDPVTIVASVIFAPVGEEILCRGIIMYYCEKMSQGIKNEKVSFWIANVVQAFFFGVMHANFVQGTYAFVLGMGLGLLTRRFKSLYPAMLCHFAVNFLSTFVMERLFGWLPENVAGTVIISGLGIVVTALAAWILREKQEKNSKETAVGL